MRGVDRHEFNVAADDGHNTRFTGCLGRFRGRWLVTGVARDNDPREHAEKTNAEHLSAVAHGFSPESGTFHVSMMDPPMMHVVAVPQMCFIPSAIA